MGGSRHGGVDPAEALQRAVAAALAPLAEGAAVVVAVSGGPDSVVLAHAVARARPDLRLTVAHVRHGLRDDRADARAAAATGAALAAAYREVAVTVPGAGGLEAAARRARYAALADVAARCGAAWVLTGHTADDQAETVLLNIARGAGLRGAAGMPQARPLGAATLLRPLLRVRRATVRAVAAALQADGVAIATDPTNRDRHHRRNRARDEVLGSLATLTGAGTDPVDALTRLADAARVDTAALDDLAAAHVHRLRRAWGPVVAVPQPALAALAPAVATRVVRLLTAGVAGAVEPGDTTGWPAARTVALLLDLRPGAAATLPGGVTASAGGGWLALRRGSGRLPERALGDAGSGALELPELGVVVRWAERPEPGLLPFWAPAGAAAVVPVPAGSLVVRAPAEGDRLVGAGGPRRLSRALSAAGVPRVARPFAVVVADRNGPVWVPGVGVRAGLDRAGGRFLRLDAFGAGPGPG